MRISEKEAGHISLLRQRTEEVLRGKPIELGDLSSEDIQYLLHELHVHQAELSLHNEELHQVQLELEISRDQYSDLYNFAPAGYCTINRQDRILEANYTLAVLLGMERTNCSKRTCRTLSPGKTKISFISTASALSKHASPMSAKSRW